MMKGKNELEKGITLIALIITIIILSILAGVTLGTLSRTGIFSKATNSKDKYVNAQEKENRLLNETMQIMENEGRKVKEPKKIEDNVDSRIKDWLSAAQLNIDNYEDKSLAGILSNQDICNTLMNSDDALNYMINQRYLIDEITGNSNGMTAIANSSKAMTKMGSNQYSSYKVVMSEYFNTIKASSYISNFENGTKINSATITSNGDSVISANATNKSSEQQYKVFDDDTNTSVGFSTNGGYIFIAYDFKEPVICYKMEINPDGAYSDDWWNKYGNISYADSANPSRLSALMSYENDKPGIYNSYYIENRQAHRIWGISDLKRRDKRTASNFSTNIRELKIYYVKVPTE